MGKGFGMKRFIATAMTVVFLMVTMVTVGFAADRIGVIDLALIMDESKAGKEANEVLAEFIQERQQALQPLETRLTELNDIVENGDSELADDERVAKEEELGAVVQEYTATVNAFESEIQSVLQSLRNHIMSEIGVVLQIVGDESGFDVIVDTSSVYYYRRVVDLTSEVIRKYDTLWDEARQQANEQSETQE